MRPIPNARGDKENVEGDDDVAPEGPPETPAGSRRVTEFFRASGGETNDAS